MVYRKYSITSKRFFPIKDVSKTVYQIREDLLAVKKSSGIPGPTGPPGDPYPDINSALKEWTQGKLYEPLTIAYDGDGNVLTASAIWPDGATGTLVMTDWNVDHETWDGYNISHSDTGITVTQAPVTRNADGAIVIKPALTAI